MVDLFRHQGGEWLVFGFLNKIRESSKAAIERLVVGHEGRGNYFELLNIVEQSSYVITILTNCFDAYFPPVAGELDHSHNLLEFRVQVHVVQQDVALGRVRFRPGCLGVLVLLRCGLGWW